MQWPEKTWKTGLTLYRVYPKAYPINSFNPNTSVNPGDVHAGGRFHPIEDAKGNRIPTVYLADHPLAALAETLLRDPKKGTTVKKKDIFANGLAPVQVTHDLRLVDLGHSSLNSGYDELIGKGSDVYSATRILAASIHARETWAHGIYWNGKQLGVQGMKCMALFGDRIDKLAIEVLDKFSLHEGDGLEYLRDGAATRGFTLPESLL